MKIEIRQIGPHDLSLCHEHFARHKTESGQDGIHFMPYEQNDEAGPIGPVSEYLVLPLSKPRWQRWFVAFPDGEERVVGHVNLSGSPLKTALHRCELGIGIEHPYRQSGIGKKLMETAIQFARQVELLSWIDICVFANNKPDRELYMEFGFVEVGMLNDRFRIGNSSIDDVAMTLEVAR